MLLCMYVSIWIKHHNTTNTIHCFLLLSLFQFLIIPLFFLREKKNNLVHINLSQLCQVPQTGYKGLSAELTQHDVGAVMLSWSQAQTGISLTQSQGMVPNSLSPQLNNGPFIWLLCIQGICSSVGSVLLPYCTPQLCTTGKFSKQIRAHKCSFLPFHSTIFYWSVTHTSQMNTPWLLPT